MKKKLRIKRDKGNLKIKKAVYLKMDDVYTIKGNLRLGKIIFSLSSGGKMKILKETMALYGDGEIRVDQAIKLMGEVIDLKRKEK